MTFIGVISDSKSFEKIQENIKEKWEQEIKLIHINKKSIGNIKNIRFETIIIDEDLSDFKREENTIRELCMYAKYLIINTDINLKFDLSNENKTNIITYGLNQKATVTVSSITDTDILLYLQRNIKDKKGTIIEVEEKRIPIREEKKLKTYEILIIYILYLVYQKAIIEEI